MKKLILPAVAISILPILHVAIDEQNVSTSNNMTSNTVLVLLVGMALFLFLIYWLKRKYFVGIMDFKQIFTMGLKMTVISAIIIVLFLFVYINFVNLQFIDNLRQLQESKVLKMSENTGKDATRALKMMEFFITPLGVIISTFFSKILGGAIYSLIAAIAFRTKEIKTA